MKRNPIIFILISIIVICTPCSSFAAAEGPLCVYDGDTKVKEYSFADLQSISSSEGNISYTYTGYNTYATYKRISNEGGLRACGPSVLGLLQNAGINISDLSTNDTITILGSDGYGCRLTYDQFTAERFYFPNGKSGTQNGRKGNASSFEAPEPVPIIIDLADTEEDSTLRVGQQFPNEQNWPMHVNNMTGVKRIDEKTGKEKVAKIILKHGNATQEPATLIPSVKPQTSVVPGQKISINGGAHYNKIYYTVDGTEPTLNSDIYNYNSYPESEANRTITIPDKVGSTFTIKCFKHRFGYFDSDVQTFTYKIVAVKKGLTYTVNNQKYKVTKVATSTARGTVTFTKSKNAKTVYVPKAVKLRDGKYYSVNIVAAKAFTPTKVRNAYIGANVTTLKPYALKGSRATKVFIKTKKLKKANVKKSLTGSKVKYVVIRVGTKKANRTYTTKYKKFFTKANAGRKVTVKY